MKRSRPLVLLLSTLVLFAASARPALASVTETVLTSAGSDQRPFWSPDGTTIVFDSNRSGNRDLWSLPSAGGAATQLTFGLDLERQPAWSPDGTQMAFAANPGGGVTNLYLRPAAGGAAVLLHADPANADGFPAWSPDGSTLVYAKGNDLYLISAAGGTPVQLTTSPGQDTHPAWSPDGTMIAFQSDRAGNDDIWVVPAAGGAPTQLTTDAAADGAPEYSPDGAYLAFQSNRAGNDDIFLMAAGGGPQVPITTDPGADVQPSWSSVTSDLAFARNGGLMIAQFAPLDLQVAGSVSQAAPAEGDLVTFTVTITNVGPNAETALDAAVTLPVGLAYVSDAPGQGSYNSVSGVWTVGAVPAGGAASLSVNATVAPTTGGQTLPVDAALLATGGLDVDPGNDTASPAVSVTAPVVSPATETQITAILGDQRPSWSPDGTTFLFDSNRSGNQDLWSVPVSGGTATQITVGTGIDRHPSWSPDGTTIVYVASIGGANPDLYLRPAAGGAATLVHSDPANVDGFPVFSPDGLTIAYRKGDDLYLIPASGGTPVALTTDPARDSHPAWSPDGTMIAFQSDRAGNDDIWIIPAAGGTAVPLTVGPAADGLPAWSPDGEDIAFQSDRTGDNEIWIVPAAGGAVRRVTTDPGNDLAPSWDPASNQLAFARDGALWVSSFAAVDVSLAAAVNLPFANEGDAITFTVDASNLGPDAATGVTVTDILPAGVTLVSASATQGAYTAVSGAWDIGGLGVGTTASLTLHVTVNAGTAGTAITNSAAVAAVDQKDPFPANDSASAGFGVLMLTQITFGATDRNPAWSPDGNTVYFDAYFGPNKDVVQVPATGGTITALVNKPSRDGEPDASPVNGDVVFSTSRGSSNADLFIVPAAGGTPVLLASDASAADRHPAWSPDGTTIAYAKGEDLYLIPAAGGTPTALTTGPVRDLYPSWSPDGLTLVYQSDASGNLDLWTIPVTGGTPVQLTTDAAVDGNPDWSPDGTWIVFQSTRTGAGELWIYEVATGALLPLTNDPASDAREPAWSPTGDRVVFANGAGLWILTIPQPAAARGNVPATAESAGEVLPVGPIADAGGSAMTFQLSGGHPNPFRGQTTVEFVLPVPTHARVTVFDVTGRQIRALVDRPLTAGLHAPVWDGRDDGGRRVAAGVYFVNLRAADWNATRKTIRVD